MHPLLPRNFYNASATWSLRTEYALLRTGHGTAVHLCQSIGSTTSPIKRPAFYPLAPGMSLSVSSYQTPCYCSSPTPTCTPSLDISAVCRTFTLLVSTEQSTRRGPPPRPLPHQPRPVPLRIGPMADSWLAPQPTPTAYCYCRCIEAHPHLLWRLVACLVAAGQH